MAQPRLYYRHWSWKIMCSIIFVIISSSSSSPSLSTYWKRVAERSVVSSAALTVEARSRTDCVRQCQEGCGSAAFDAASRTCSLEPSHSTGEQEGLADVYTVHTANECKISDVPVTPNAHVTDWRVTSSSLEGDVSCDEDFMSGDDDVTSTVVCHLDSAEWSIPSEECLQYVWRNYTAINGMHYHLARSPVAGEWCVHLKGTPTSNNRQIHCNMMINETYNALRVIVNMASQTTVLAVKQDGEIEMRVPFLHPSPHFPFSQNVTFDMVIRSLTENVFKIEVNGDDYVNYTSVMSVSDVIKVECHGYVTLEYLNLWC